MYRYLRTIFIIVLVLACDQGLKLWVHANMNIGDEFHIITKKFIIHYTENNGMAYGMELGGDYGKLALTLFRLIAISFIAYGLFYIIKKRYHWGLIVCVAFIFAGAMGNIIDSVFYGIAFQYAPLFHGRVIDMLYFPLFIGQFPEWFPVYAGQEFLFFRPVFNIADAAISLGVAFIILFQKRYFAEELVYSIDTENEEEEE